LRANGGVWHKEHREAGIMPHLTIDTQAQWSKSGYHGWRFGWKLHLARAIASVWIPLAAELTPANTADNEVAPRLHRQLPLEVRYILGDAHYTDPALRTACKLSDRLLAASRRGWYRVGVEVRRIFHKLCSTAIEPFNGLYKNVFEWGGQVPVKGLKRPD
jgi:hypothetical protein